MKGKGKIWAKLSRNTKGIGSGLTPAFSTKHCRDLAEFFCNFTITLVQNRIDDEAWQSVFLASLRDLSKSDSVLASAVKGTLCVDQNSIDGARFEKDGIACLTGQAGRRNNIDASQPKFMQNHLDDG
jgi:hypothetical protein